MDIFESANANDLYLDLTKYILENGEAYSPRGMETREIQPAITVINNPRERVLTTPGRKPNPFFNLVEALWILSGRGDAEFILFYNSQLKKYLDKKENGDYHKYFHGAYGNRIRKYGFDASAEKAIHLDRGCIDQFSNVIKTLEKDKDSRRAVICLWDPMQDFEDITEKKLDLPCNSLLMFKIRNDKLNMTVCNRSNDLHLGLMFTNIVQFSVIQEALATVLNVGVGVYHHLSDSLHIYTDSEISKNILNADYKFNVYDYVDPVRMDFENLRQLDDELDLIMIADRRMREEEDLLECRSLANMFKSKFFKDCFHILYSFHLHKVGLYPMSLGALLRCDMLDWKISCMEFLNRSYKKRIDDKRLLESLMNMMNYEIKSLKLGEDATENIIKFIRTG